MQKVVAKVDEGKIGVLYRVDKRKVFSDDFKTIIRSMMLGNIVKAYGAGELEPGDEAPMNETLKDVLQIVIEAVPLLMRSCLEDLKDEKNYTKEMADLGLAPESALEKLKEEEQSEEKSEDERP